MSKRLLKSIQTLQRMKQVELEALQVQLAAMRERERMLIEEVERLKQEREREYGQAIILLVPSNQAYFHKNTTRQKDVENLIVVLLRDMAAVEERLKEIYTDKKRLESVQKTTEEKMKKAEDLSEQSVIDQLSSIEHFRNG